MNYVLKLFDLPLLKFTVMEDIAAPVLEILWVNKEKRELLHSTSHQRQRVLQSGYAAERFPRIVRSFIHFWPNAI